MLPLQQVRLCWCSYVSTIFTSGFTPDVHAWRVTCREGSGGHGAFSVEERGTLDGSGERGKARHRDVVQTFLCIEGAVDPETNVSPVVRFFYRSFYRSFYRAFRQEYQHPCDSLAYGLHVHRP